VDLVAHLITRDSEDGWRNTLAPVSAGDHVRMTNVQRAPVTKPSSDPALSAFADWAAR